MTVKFAQIRASGHRCSEKFGRPFPQKNQRHTALSRPNRPNCPIRACYREIEGPAGPTAMHQMLDRPNPRPPRATPKNAPTPTRHTTKATICNVMQREQYVPVSMAPVREEAGRCDECSVMQHATKENGARNGHARPRPLAPFGERAAAIVQWL